MHSLSKRISTFSQVPIKRSRVCSTVTSHKIVPKALPLPSYLVNTYTWAYLTPSSLLLDNAVVPNAILWGNMDKLVQSSVAEFKEGDRVLQAANAYGHLGPTLAAKLGSKGFLDLIDIAEIQVQHATEKLSQFPQVRVRQADAAHPGDEIYDAALCFFLLHEVPDDYKVSIVNALMDRVKPGGKVVFIDYHLPVIYHPLRPLMMMVFKFLEPYAVGLIRKEILDFVSENNKPIFKWEKETFFGGLYQKVIATKSE
uniref:Putative rhodoquinone biosynthesis methyltransferase-like protein RQUA n=1 Tax=Copromyxa protea TaxID=931554 RepID=A0A1S4VFK7_9EUKA|nr:putative rhodoquinone biosynthesis methyltransferase-like protein RQUA [Copromyxa protea]